MRDSELFSEPEAQPPYKPHPQLLLGNQPAQGLQLWPKLQAEKDVMKFTFKSEFHTWGAEKEAKEPLKPPMGVLNKRTQSSFWYPIMYD